MSAIDSLPRELCFSRPRQPSSLILDEEVKLSLQDFLSTPLTSSTTNNKAYKILLTGRVDKKSSYLFYQPRQLVLTNEPKLKYIDPNTNQLKVLLKHSLTAIFSSLFSQERNSSYLKHEHTIGKQNQIPRINPDAEVHI